MTLNDFKSVEGDRRMGLLSLPVQMGSDAGRPLRLPGDGGAAGGGDRAARRLGARGTPASWRRCSPGSSALMVRFLESPRERAAWYNGTGTTLYVLGMLVAAFALRPLVGGA